MNPLLSSVPSTAPDPPYPPETKSNGFRQEIDLDRILASKTWTLADHECRPWLVLIWILSWRNVPCGTWEPDDEFIAASIGCKFEWFQGHRVQLMRGWVRHSDGLLYHQFITSQVLEMLARRRSTVGRVKKYRELREAKKRAVTVCNALPSVTYAEEQDQEQDEDKKDMLTHVRAKPDSVSVRKPSPPCPYAQILDLWREILPELPQPRGVENWTDARKSQIRARWNNELPSLDLWRTMMEDIRKSKFLMGKVPPSTGHRQFRCDLFWITKPEHLLRLMENKYHG